MVTRMSDNFLTIATRRSPLALWQAHYIQQRLMRCHPQLNVKLMPLVTQGDVLIDTPLAKVGGKGLFVKELEHALLEKRADIAVHSMKDVPITFPEKLGLGAICEQENPFDSFVSNRYDSLSALPYGAVVGTSSLRRECQIRERHPNLVIQPLRGNVNTRLSKLDAHQYDAIILAVAGLKRLGLQHRIRYVLTAEDSLPAAGQGAMGIECRLDDPRVVRLVSALNDEDTAVRIKAERAMNARLEGGCQVPIASYAVLEKNNLWLRGLVGSPDGTQVIRAERRGSRDDAEKIGTLLAEELLDKGAHTILAQVYQGNPPR